MTKRGGLLHVYHQRNHALPAGQLSLVDGITHRAMMGEYIIYIHGKIAAYVCDNRLFVKPVDAAREICCPTQP